MLFFLFTGVQNSGKTTAVKNIYDYLVCNGYVLTVSIVPPLPLTSILPPQDFSCIATNGIKTVIIHSACDSPEAIDQLIKLYKAHPSVDAIISCVRAPISSVNANPFDPRTYFFDNLQPYLLGNFCIELPVGKIHGNLANYTTLLVWHHSTIASTAQHILTSAPFNL